MSLNPAKDDIEARKKRESIELCGRNRGPHDYIPIQWVTIDNHKRVTRLMCRTCFTNISMHILIENYPEVTV